MNQTNAVKQRIDLWRFRTEAWRGRSTRFGLALRAVLYVAGTTALLLASPSFINLGGWLAVAMLLPIVAMARPSGFWVLAVQVTAVAAWIGGTFDQDHPSMIRAFLIGAVLYLHHSSASLAALWRVDAVVDPAVRRSWMLRTGGVLLGAGVVGSCIAVLTRQPLPLPGTALLVVGALGTLVVAGGLALLSRQR